MIPVLFKKDEKQFRTYGLGQITDIINPKVTRERNGQYSLYFQYPQDAEFVDVFEEDMRIKSDAGVRTKWQTFEISRVVREEGKLIEVFAKHISQSLLKDALNPNVNVRSSNAQQALRTWNSNRIGDEEFDVWSDISTINSTNWNIQDVSNAFKALAGVQGSILDVWGGEYEFDNKLIRLHKEMGRKSPVPLEYGRNITGLEQDQQDDNVYTSVYPFATYIPESGSEPETVTLPERYVDGKYLEMHNKRKIQVVDFSGEFESDDIPTASRLRTLAKQYIESNEIGMPHENLKVEYIDLSKTLDYHEFQTMEEVELNDRLPIFYPKFRITNENAKVVVINYDPVKEENMSIELGVIGQSFRTVTTGGVDSRLDRIEKQQKETVNYIVNNKGNRIWFETPDENMEHKIGDTWFEKNGPYDRIRVWNGNQWETIIDSEDIDKNAKAITEQQQEIEETKQIADEAVEQIDTAVANAGFTSLDETISSVQTISSQAQINSGTAINNALEAMQQASQAVDNTGSLNVRVDEVENTLSVKADKQSVDDLTGVVDSQALDIRANADGLALKANQNTVDTLAGTVQSLGSEFDIVAGQVNSRVWNTDIETAIDGIEVGGRNLLPTIYDLFTHDGGTYGFYKFLEEPEQVIVTVRDRDTSVDMGGIFFGLTQTGHNFTDGTWLMSRGSLLRRELLSNDQNYFSYYPNNEETLNKIFQRFNIKIEKGNKATDWTPAPEDTLARFDHIETEWTQTFDSFSQTVSGIDGRVTSQKQTIDSISSTVSGYGDRISTVEQTADGLQTTVASKASQTQVTQLGDLLSSTVEDVEGNATQISQNATNINLRVEKGDVLSQINIEAERTLIQSDKLLLNATNTVITGTAWMDGAIIANASIDTAQIADLAVSSAKVASLDVSKLSGNITNFVQSNWNDSAGGNVRVTGSGIVTTASDNSQVYIQQGIMGVRNPSGASLGHIGYKNVDGPHYAIQTSHGSHFSIFTRPTVGTDYNAFQIIGSAETYIRTDETRVSQLLVGNGLNVLNGNSLVMSGGSVQGAYGYNFQYGGRIYVVSSNSNLVVESSNQLWLSSNGSRALYFDQTYGYMSRHLSMGGNNITGQSDERLKTNILDHKESSLAKINQFNFVDFEWKKDGRTGFGVIAQQVQQVAPELILKGVEGYLNLNNSLLNMMTTHALQELNKKHDTVAQTVDSHTDTIHTLQQELSKANRRIEELEGAM